MSNIIKTKISKKVNSFFQRFGKFMSLPKTKFVKDMVIGLLISGSVHLSVIVRALKERDKKYKHTDKRLRRNIGRKDFDKELREKYLQMNRNIFRKFRYLVIDGSDIQKAYAVKMEYIDRVRDGDKGSIGNGYHQLNVLGVDEGGASLQCIYTDLYSLKEGDTVSENNKILNAADILFRYLDKSSQIMVIDRGADRIRLIEPFIKSRKHFIIRLTHKRYLVIDGDIVGYKGWQERVNLNREVSVKKIRKDGRVKREVYRIGIKEVNLPHKGLSDKKLWLLVSKKTGIGIKKEDGYSYYLGFLPSDVSADEAMEIIFKGYGQRWKIEEYHRHIKNAFKIEEISFQRYQALKTMNQLVMISAFFIYKEMKQVGIEILQHKLSPGELTKIIKRGFRFVYYKITEELRLILRTMHFYKKITFKRTKKKKVLILFPSYEMETSF